MAAPMISYAQMLEDVLLARAFAGQESGFYVDVGAAHPVELSVTKHFYESGWRGVNVEPVEELFERLSADRPRDVNLQVVLSDHEGAATLFVAPGFFELSSVSAKQVGVVGGELDLVPRPVEVTTLARVCDRYAPAVVDFLKIDVEGHEQQVIAGGDWQRHRPRVLVIECFVHGSSKSSHEEWESPLLAAGYRHASSDGVNRFYAREEEPELLDRLRTPVDAYVRHDRVERLERVKEELRRRHRAAAPM